MSTLSPLSSITPATLSEMQYLLESAKQEGWNPGIHDAIPYYFTDPNGFFIEHIEGRPIGCISAVAHNDNYGFMGFYIIEPELRHLGYGIKLWDHAITYLGNRTIGLDGVVAQQDNYRKSGFEFYCNNIRFEGKAKGTSQPKLQTLDTIPFDKLLEYDSKIIGFNRSFFLQHWMTMPDCYGLAKTHAGKVTGYGVIRKCNQGYKIGPLFADTPEIANELYLGLTAPFEGHSIFLDVIQTHSNGLDLAREHQLSPVFETARMYKGEPPKQRIDNIFGITSFELG